jgi:hypothetical protein
MIVALAISLVLAISVGPAAREPGQSGASKGAYGPQRTLVLDGSPVHDVGNLHLHVPNWGILGSMPGSGMTFQNAPSAEWPAESGVEHLYVAGLWVGAMKGGVPAVSTSAYEAEFRPTIDPLDVVYYAAEGDPGGTRLPDPGADDDTDGMIDEEWLDGRDNDADGSIDEDFAAVSDQMLSCWYTDTDSEIFFPQHNPLGLEVRQRSFQWSNPDYDDFIGFEFTLKNVGTEVLQGLFVGFFVDGDVGPRGTPNYWDDDACAYYDAGIRCTPYGAFPLDIAYVYDVDGDQGQSPGYCGLLFLGYPTDATGDLAPEKVGISTFAVFSGSQSYEDGGDPTNDFERYELMSSETVERNATIPADQRFMICAGPFSVLEPGSTLVFSAAIVAGEGLTELLQHAEGAMNTYRGGWFDVDGDPTTGVAGRETPIPGPATNVAVDTCNSPGQVIPFVPHGTTIWINNDCAQEAMSEATCGYAPGDSARYMTGVFGRERQVHWILPTETLVPVSISYIDVSATPEAAIVRWEVFADELFEGYRLYRAVDGGPAAALPATSGLIPPQAVSYTDADVSAGRTYRYNLAAVMTDGSEVRSRTVETVIPAWSTTLHQNKPNPFNPSTTISFTLDEESAVTLSIYTSDGKLVTTLVDETLPAGLRQVPWDGRNADGTALSSGVYFYRLKAGKTVLSRKMVYLK